jgi:hypothetical protein
LVWLFSRQKFGLNIFTPKFWSKYFHANILVWIFSRQYFSLNIFTPYFGLNIFTPYFGPNIFTPILWSPGYFHKIFWSEYIHANILIWKYSRQKIGLNIFHCCIGCMFCYNCHQ